MTAASFTRFASILLGLVSLFVAFRAVPNALAWPRAPLDDTLRFGFILLTAATGLMLLVAGQTGLRRIAESRGPNLLRIGAALAIVSFAGVTRLSDALPLWAALSVVGVAIVTFVLPAPAFRGVAGPPAMSLREISPLTGAWIRQRPRWVRLAVVATFLLPVLGAFGMFAPSAILSQPWGAISGWASALGGCLMAGVFFYISAGPVPADFRRGTLTGLALWTAVMLLIAGFGMWFLLARGVPAVAGGLSGREAAQIVTVLAVDPFENRKGCRGEVTVRTTAGRQDICNLRREFLQSLRPGDSLEVSGRATWFGQTISGVHRVRGAD